MCIHAVFRFDLFANTKVVLGHYEQDFTKFTFIYTFTKSTLLFGEKISSTKLGLIFFNLKRNLN